MGWFNFGAYPSGPDMSSFPGFNNNDVGSSNPRTNPRVSLANDLSDVIGSVAKDINSANIDNMFNMPVGDTNAGVLGNFDDESSWNRYLELVNMSNRYNSAEAHAARMENRFLRDSQITSILNQLRENGVNPILAFGHGVSTGSYPTSAQASSYAGSTPYSNSATIDSTIIKTIGELIGDVLSLVGDLKSVSLKKVVGSKVKK